MGYIVWSLADLKEVLLAWQLNKFDGLIVIDGNRGLGKSTLAIKIATKLNIGFKLKKDICFSREDVFQQLVEKRKGIIIADEMINVTYNRDFYNTEQKDFIKTLNMVRDSGNILIACVPNFYDLDKQFRNLVKMRLNVIRRGLAVIHTKNQTSFSVDKWDMKTNEKIEQNFIKRRVFKPNYRKLTTFRGFISFRPLSPLRQELYDKIKEEKRQRIWEENKALEMKKTLVDTVMEKLKAGLIKSEQEINLMCSASNYNYMTMMRKLNAKLREDDVTLNVKKIIKENINAGKPLILESERFDVI